MAKKINLHRVWFRDIKWLSYKHAELTLTAHRTENYKLGQEAIDVILHINNWDINRIAQLLWNKLKEDKKQFDLDHKLTIDLMKGEE